MKFSVITPSFRASRWLKLCIASVADQSHPEREHIVQDACSDDGTGDWLPGDTRVSAYIEKDRGMYDAINRGLRRATGDVFSYLNADEQYLPGALQAVAGLLQADPAIDVVFAHTVVVDSQGSFLCYRKAVRPSRVHIQVSHLPVLSSSMFFTRRAVERHDLYFDPAMKALGDARWVLKALSKGVRCALLPAFVSAFTDTGENLALSPQALAESREMFDSAPFWARKLPGLVILQHRVMKLLSGAYTQQPFSYEIYTRTSQDKRVRFEVTRPGFFWHSRNPK